MAISSVGGNMHGFWYAFGDHDAYNLRHTTARGQRQQAATRGGIVVVLAAGNDGPGNNTVNPYAVAAWVIGIAAPNNDEETRGLLVPRHDGWPRLPANGHRSELARARSGSHDPRGRCPDRRRHA